MSDCKDTGVRPVIDRNKCEGKKDCVEVCPYHVFEVRKLTVEERAPLKTLARVKSFFHGYQQAFAVRVDACQSCGLCVTNCPEKAIKLSAA